MPTQATKADPHWLRWSDDELASAYFPGHRLRATRRWPARVNWGAVILWPQGYFISSRCHFWARVDDQLAMAVQGLRRKWAP